MSQKLNCILLIDDDKLTNLTNRIIIDQADCAHYVIKKESGVAGLKYLSDSAKEGNGLPFPNLIFLDISMPEIDGWDFMKYYNHIKQGLPSKPIIYMLSSFAIDQEILTVSHAAHLSGICEKPLTPETFQAILDKNFICA